MYKSIFILVADSNMLFCSILII